MALSIITSRSSGNHAINTSLQDDNHFIPDLIIISEWFSERKFDTCLGVKSLDVAR